MATPRQEIQFFPCFRPSSFLFGREGRGGGWGKYVLDSWFGEGLVVVVKEKRKHLNKVQQLFDTFDLHR